SRGCRGVARFARHARRRRRGLTGETWFPPCRRDRGFLGIPVGTRREFAAEPWLPRRSSGRSTRAGEEEGFTGETWFPLCLRDRSFVVVRNGGDIRSPVLLD